MEALGKFVATCVLLVLMACVLWFFPWSKYIIEVQCGDTEVTIREDNSVITSVDFETPRADDDPLQWRLGARGQAIEDFGQTLPVLDDMGYKSARFYVRDVKDTSHRVELSEFNHLDDVDTFKAFIAFVDERGDIIPPDVPAFPRDDDHFDFRDVKHALEESPQCEITRTINLRHRTHRPIR